MCIRDSFYSKQDEIRQNIVCLLRIYLYLHLAHLNRLAIPLKLRKMYRLLLLTFWFSYLEFLLRLSRSYPFLDRLHSPERVLFFSNNLLSWLSIPVNENKEKGWMRYSRFFLHTVNAISPTEVLSDRCITFFFNFLIFHTPNWVIKQSSSTLLHEELYNFSSTKFRIGAFRLSTTFFRARS